MTLSNNGGTKKINPEQFVASIKDAFEQPPQDLGLSTVLRDLDGWDSLTSVMLVAEIYAGYRVEVSGDDLLSCRTVADLMSTIEAKLAPLS